MMSYPVYNQDYTITAILSSQYAENIFLEAVGNSLKSFIGKTTPELKAYR